MPGQLSLYSNEIKFEFSHQKRTSLPVAFETNASAGGCPAYLTHCQVSVRGSRKTMMNSQHLWDKSNCQQQASASSPSESLYHLAQADVEERFEGGHSSHPLQEWTSPTGDEALSTSPSASINSGISSPSETGGDSGVCSEHDTSPLECRKPRCNSRRNVSSDSDNDSSISSESLQELITESPSLSEEAKKPDKHSDHPLIKKSSRVASCFRAKRTRLPESLLREIREKYNELQRKRQLMQGDIHGRDRSPLSRANYYQRSTRISRIHSPVTTIPLHQEFATLSLVESSNYSSTTSLQTEDEDQFPCFHSAFKKPLYECKDETASEGFAGLSDIFAPQQESTIKSLKGTVRGVKNRVRAGIVTFTSDHRFLKLYAERERGKVVVYLSTLGIVRETFERCLRVRKILWTLLVHFDERDVFMSRDTQIQLIDRLHARIVSVPHVFLEGQYLGGVELLEKLNETGELRRLLQPYMRPASTSPCDTCGGFHLLPCSVCGGSKKSVHRNNFTLEFVALKCSSCDEAGLVSCHECSAAT